MKKFLRKWLGIDELATISSHYELLREVEQLKKKLGQLDEFGALTENSKLYHIINRLVAIQDYLKLDIKWHWENDPSRLPEPHPQVRVWKAYKKEGINKKEYPKKKRDSSVKHYIKETF